MIKAGTKLMAIKIASFAIIMCVILILLRKESESFAIILNIMTGVFIFYLILPELNKILLVINNLGQNINVNTFYIAILLKTIGIAYISEFASQICNDAGEKAIASKISLGGKILILSFSVPIFNELLQTVLNLM